MNIKSVFAGALLISQIATCNGQTHSFIVSPGITLPKDSTTQSQLLTALNGFLSQKEKPGKENTYVLRAHLLETSALLDEMKQVEENNELKEPTFYKCYLTNVIPLNENDYLIQCSYIGINENGDHDGVCVAKLKARFQSTRDRGICDAAAERQFKTVVFSNRAAGESLMPPQPMRPTA